MKKILMVLGILSLVLLTGCNKEKEDLSYESFIKDIEYDKLLNFLNGSTWVCEEYEQVAVLKYNNTCNYKSYLYFQGDKPQDYNFSYIAEYKGCSYKDSPERINNCNNYNCIIFDDENTLINSEPVEVYEDGKCLKSVLVRY